MIRLSLTDRLIDELPTRLVVASFFEDLRPLKGQVGLLDWRLNGRLSELILKGKLEGKRGEALMMPSARRIAAQEILLFGLGRSGELTEGQLEELFGQIVEKIRRLKTNECGISFGDLARDFMGWRSLLRSFVNCLAQRSGEEDFHLICSEEGRWIEEARRRNMDFGPLVSLRYDESPEISGVKSDVA